MNTAKRLLHLFPDGDIERDWEIVGDTIHKWHRAEPQPTTQELDAVTEQQEDDAIDAREYNRSFSLSRKDKVIIKWIASRTGRGTAQSIRAELKAIWDNTN